MTSRRGRASWPCALTAWPSVTGSADEAAFAQRLANDLSHFDLVVDEAIPGDRAKRSNVFALKRGRGRRTIVLTGHFDVVPVDDYGALKPLAFDAPSAAARDRWRGSPAAAIIPRRWPTSRAATFCPGRGLLDMKAGLAAGLAAMEALQGEGNLLFLAVADEEDRSAGARAAVAQLPWISRRHRTSTSRWSSISMPSPTRATAAPAGSWRWAPSASCCSPPS